MDTEVRFESDCEVGMISVSEVTETVLLALKVVGFITVL